MYRIQQFAQLAGVTVKTLHHYDRLNLLKPRHRTDGGYRLYALEDLAQLQRILVLRYLGLPLREIAELLRHAKVAPVDTLSETLARQALVLRERRDGISRVLTAVEHAQYQLQTATAPDWTLYQTILKEIQMQQSQDWARKYYSNEAQQSVDELAKTWTPERQAEISAQWAGMFHKVEDAIARNLDPASPEARAIAAGWMGLVEQFTGGRKDVLEGLNKLYADREHWPEAQLEKAPVKPELMAWIRKVQAS